MAPQTSTLLPQPRLIAGAHAPVRRAVRRFRWFKRTFHEQTALISRASGVVYRVHDERLARVFVGWLRAFEAQKPAQELASASGDRRDYVAFASGLMLRQLVREKPLQLESAPVGCDASNPAYYWPEGYVYVAYCLNVRAAVLAQEFDATTDLAPDFDDIRAWWTFKENTAEDPSLAIAFLDLFAGEAPNWSTPSIFYREVARAGLPPVSAPALRAPE